LKIRIFTTYPPADASRRLRIDPLSDALRLDGMEVVTHTLLTPAMFRDKNARGPRRWLVAAKLAWRLAWRCYELATVSPSELAIIHREAFPFFTPVAERWIGRRAAAMVLDVDDALYAEPTHSADWRRWLRSPRGFDQVLVAADLVLGGSPALCQRATKLGTPSTLQYTVPPPEARILARTPSAKPTLVWIGSQSTLGSLRGVLDDLLAACEEIDATLAVLGGSNIAELPGHPRLRAERWTRDRELRALGEAWLGLMPLPDTEWEAGKSAYKLMLYLFAGLPVAASPVGMNRIFAGAPGVTLVDTETGWRKALHDALEGTPTGEEARAWIEALVRPEEQLDRAVSSIAELCPETP